MKTKLITSLLFAMMIFTLPTLAMAEKYQGKFINLTSDTVRVAVVYNDVNDGWVNTGWVKLAPNSSEVFTFDLQSSNMYVYGQTEEVEWSGDEGEYSFPIRDEKFYYKTTKHPGSDYYNVSFIPFTLSRSTIEEYDFEY